MEPIYLDYNATTPLAPEVAAAMQPFLETYFGNPSSSHAFGTITKKAIEKARSQVAALINCRPSEIIFTSGGTESNNYAIKGIAYANRTRGSHIITSSIEHPAVFEVCRYLEKQGFRVTYLPVDEDGLVQIRDLEKAITNDTILVTIMHANNEVGTIQPIGEIAAIARKKGIIMHTDAAQSTGKIITDVAEMGIDLLSIAGHKLYGPKGVGALFIREGTVLEKLIHGADHEQNLRAGTENVLEIVGLGRACELALTELGQNSLKNKENRDLLQKLIKEAVPTVRINGHPTKRLPNTLSISFPGVDANTLLQRIDKVAASSGAACHSENMDVSGVLEAMDVPVQYAMGTIRFTTGRGTTREDITEAAKEVIIHAKSLMGEETKDVWSVKSDLSSIKLTKYTHGLGCACKIEPQKLEKILSSLPFKADKNILVGTETSDDAAIYRISDELALVQTLDFFTPIVDDPYDFGAIAAANALSDIYAMGATPLFAMNIVGFPEETLPLTVLEMILNGAHEKAMEAGIQVIGGHTIEDPEPKYGMVVSGKIHPDDIVRNTGALPGDKLILTKSLGTGILSTALKRGMIENELSQLMIQQMKELNNIAAGIMTQHGVHACTDITGFGLLGHLGEITRSSEVDAVLRFECVPFLPEVHNLAAGNIIPGGTYDNLAYVAQILDAGKLGKVSQLMLADAQTSGGLLMAIPAENADACLDDLIKAGISHSAIIGEIRTPGPGIIHIQ